VNYYKRHIGDYMRDTSHLSLLEHGVYAKLLDLYYVHEAPIADEDAERLIGARSPAEKKACRAVLKEFFHLQDGHWHQSRCDEEIAAYRVKAQRNRLAGKQGGRPKKEGGEAKPTQNPNGFQTDSVSEPNGNPTETLATSHKPEYSVRASPSDPPSLDAALFAEARQVFGRSTGGMINQAIRDKGKPWLVDMVERCRGKDPEAARAYLAAALKPKPRGHDRVVV
jgi:uncharacterized protein YdaU (DUF1376 family)